MIKRLRLKFVAINMTLVTLLLGVILGLVYYSTAANLESDSINMLRSVAISPPLPAPGEAAEDVNLPFFVVLLGPDGEIAETTGGYFDLTYREALRSLVSEALDSPGSIGVISGRALRYYRMELPGRDCVIFADISSERATLAGLTRTCAVIGALGFAAFLALSIVLSRWAVRPVERAWREQKDFVAAAFTRLAGILLDNAVKYSRPGGRISVALRASGPRRCTLAVSDEGEPIEPEEASRIFKRFYRAERHKQSPGFGLGLAIAESTAKRARGRIRCESADGWNSFMVELPRI